LPGGPARSLLLTASVLADLLLAVLTIDRAGAWAGLSGLDHRCAIPLPRPHIPAVRNQARHRRDRGGARRPPGAGPPG